MWPEYGWISFGACARQDFGVLRRPYLNFPSGFACFSYLKVSPSWTAAPAAFRVKTPPDLLSLDPVTKRRTPPSAETPSAPWCLLL